jgi:hypothetical protein
VLKCEPAAINGKGSISNSGWLLRGQFLLRRQ